MRTKKESRSLLPGVRRLVRGVLQQAATLANVHPLVVAITPHRESHYEYERGVPAARD